MIIKTLRHKHNTIRDLLYYMVNGMENQESDLMISHNLPSFETEEIQQEFLKNDLYRQQTKAQVRWYHELLCFSPLDKDKLDTRKLFKITQQYIEMRNPNALCFAVAHMGEAHTHVHLCFSGTQYRSKKTLRMDDKTFRDLRVGMERWQQKEFPELSNSLVYVGKEKTKERAKSRDVSSRKQKEFLAKKRLKKVPEKELLKSIVKEAYNRSETTEQFYSLLKAANLTLYERNGKVTGIIGKRKYRFTTTLGLTKEMLLSFDRLAQRQREYKQLQGKSRDDLDLDR